MCAVCIWSRRLLKRAERVNVIDVLLCTVDYIVGTPPHAAIPNPQQKSYLLLVSSRFVYFALFLFPSMIRGVYVSVCESVLHKYTVTPLNGKPKTQKKKHCTMCCDNTNIINNIAVGYVQLRRRTNKNI